jgi:predicted TIM-barrel fold metal-dependent hydrolase
MAISLDDLQANTAFTRNVKGKVTLLPDPPRAQRYYTVISCDDHLVEPPHTFEGRVPAKFADRAPRVVEQDDGREMWVYDGEIVPNVGFNAVVGRPVDEYSFDPTRFDEMRKGAWDVAERVRDMDLNGVYASLNFPSFLPGFAGQRLQSTTNDRELAIACVRAWNDWMIDDWTAYAPDRFIPAQLPLLHDPEVAAAEVRRNAERGFKAITFSEAPHLLGLPSLHTGHWDPLMAACAETGTVVCLHVGSSSTSPAVAPDAPSDAVGALFFAYSMFAAVDWLYSMIPVRFPDIRICLSEGGIGWVAGLIDRFEHMRRYDTMYGTFNDVGMSPADVFRRNFWFCAIDDPSSFMQKDVIGVENIMVESDYPHCDSTWPNTQEVLHKQLAGLPKRAIDRITWRNASELFDHPVPKAIQKDPDAY